MSEGRTGDMSVREAGRRGGRKTSERHGHGFYERIGKKGGTAVAEKYDHEHFEAIGHKGGQRVAELIAKAKALEAAERSEGG